jgi:hypothetical protein
MNIDLLHFESQADQLLAGIKDNQMSAIIEGRDMVVMAAQFSKRRYLHAMLRALVKEVRKDEERARDGR